MSKDPIFPIESEILRALQDINPFWSGKDWPEIPDIQRYPFFSVLKYLKEMGSQRAIFLKGFRGVGKSTILRQMASWLRDREGVAANNIVYVDFEKRPLRKISWNAWFHLWEKEFKPADGLIYFLLDEIQYAEEWVQEVRSLLINPRYRIVVTGSAAAELQSALDDEVRRWIPVDIPALLFHEYVLIVHSRDHAYLENEILKGRPFFEKALFNEPLPDNIHRILNPLFRDYLFRGGFPETARARLKLSDIQRLLADVVDKALYQDMRNQFSREDIENLERFLEYVCRNPGMLLDKSQVSRALGVSRPTIAKYLKVLSDAGFVLILDNQDKGGKKALKAKPKVYPSDASLRNALLNRTENFFNQSEEMGLLVEGVVASHLDAYAQTVGGQMGYWRRRDNEEVDFRYERPDGTLWVIESKYGQAHPNWHRALKVWPEVEKRDIAACFLISREDKQSVAGISEKNWPLSCPLTTVAAPLFLYLLGRELRMREKNSEEKHSETGALSGKVETDVDTPTRTGSLSIKPKIMGEQHNAG